MRDERGQALAIVLGAMVILFLLLGAVLGWSSVASKQYGGENPNLQEQAALRGGVEGVIWALSNDGDGASPSSTPGTDILDTAQATYTPPSALFPALLCQPPGCVSFSVYAALENPAVALHIVGPPTVDEGTTVNYAAYATDANGDVVSTKSLGLRWGAICINGKCAGYGITSTTGTLTAPTGDSASENCQGHNCDNDEGTQIATVGIALSNSLGLTDPPTFYVQVDDEP